MGKKKITYLLLFMLLGVNANSQQLFTVKLCWKEKKEALAYLYQITYDLANDTSPVFVQYNKFNFRDMNFSDLVNKIFKKKKNKVIETGSSQSIVNFMDIWKIKDFEIALKIHSKQQNINNSNEKSLNEQTLSAISLSKKTYHNWSGAIFEIWSTNRRKKNNNNNKVVPA